MSIILNHSDCCTPSTLSLSYTNYNSNLKNSRHNHDRSATLDRAIVNKFYQPAAGRDATWRIRIKDTRFSTSLTNTVGPLGIVIDVFFRFDFISTFDKFQS